MVAHRWFRESKGHKPHEEVWACQALDRLGSEVERIVDSAVGRCSYCRLVTLSIKHEEAKGFSRKCGGQLHM